MNYKLAKKLKEAGFPQEGKKTAHYRNPETGEVGGGVIKYPTLSELIEACGEDLGRVENLKKSWVAYDTTELKRAEGDTPEEAVAKLWLKLNK